VGRHVNLAQQSGARHAAAHEQPVARGEASEEVPASEPLRRDRPALVGQVDRHQRKTAGAFLDAHDAADDDRFTVDERRDRLRDAPIAVGPRQVRQQFLRRLDAKRGKFRRGRGSDAGEAGE
jgi:hypothetical protein